MRRPATPAAGEPELRFRRGDGSWSRWASAGAHGHGPDGSAPSGTLTGDPLWSGGTTAVQLRSARALGGVRLWLVDVSSGRGARLQALATGGPFASAAALPLAMPVLAAGAGQPPIIARQAWARRVSPPRVAPEYGDVELAFVHHTDNPNGYTPGEVPAMLRAIYAFHRFVNGWNDIGYNFVLDLFGRIFEARAGGIDEPVVGAHAGGYNIYSTGIAVLGTFSEVPVSAACRQALERLLAWKLSLHGVTAIGRVTVRVDPAGARFSRFPANARVPLPHIAGHRDADTTDCPGNVLYGELPSIRRSVGLLAGRPAKATLALLSPEHGSRASPPARANRVHRERRAQGTGRGRTGHPGSDGRPVVPRRHPDRRSAGGDPDQRRCPRGGRWCSSRRSRRSRRHPAAAGRCRSPQPLPPARGRGCGRCARAPRGCRRPSRRRCTCPAASRSRLRLRLLPLPGPRRQLLRLPRREPVLGQRLHQQRRRLALAGPLVAGLVEGVVDPGQRPGP